jgi:hypothetical protein
VANDEPVDELYALPLDEFTAARNALAKQLKKDGDKEAAAEVQALKKPSLVAWALNRLARDDPDAVARLLEAGGAVRRAHRQALSGDASQLRDAGRHEQQAIAALAQQAAGILDQAGSSGAGNLERLADTLRAAATDEEAGDLLRRGRIVSDLDASGFDLTGGLTLLPSAPAGEKAPKAARDKGDAATTVRPAGATAEKANADKAKAEADEAAREQAAREQAAAERAAAERQARRARERAQTRVDAAEKKAARLEDEASRAEEVAEAARRRADEARAEANEAASHLAALG